MRNWISVLGLATCIEGLQFFASGLRIVHALQERADASIFLSPEIVRDWRSGTPWVSIGPSDMKARRERGRARGPYTIAKRMARTLTCRMAEAALGRNKGS